MKVLYKMTSQEEAEKALESMTLDVQDLALPSDAIHAAIDILERSNCLLPPNDRQFKEWSVGLIEKWEPKME